MSPKFSVIIPTYNAAATLAQALESIYVQTFTAYEVLIMDGISTDETANIAQRYCTRDSRFHFKSQKDDGIYDAMNKGLEQATGDWIFFLGSDDTLFSNDTLISIAERIDSTTAHMIYGNVKLNKPIGFNYDSLVFAGEFHPGRLLHMNICHQAIFYHRSLFTRFGTFNTAYRLLADWDFNLRCFALVEPLYINQIISNFFVGAASYEAKDEAFKKDFIKNLVFRYPYNYRHGIFHKMKRRLSGLFFQELLTLQLSRAFKVGKVLLYQLRPAAVAQAQ